MSHCCAIGARPDAEEIDAALRGGHGLGTVAKRHGLVKGTLGRHRLKCLGILVGGQPETVSETAETRETSPAPTSAPENDHTSKPAKTLAETVSALSQPLATVPRAAGEIPPRELVTSEVERRCVQLRVAGWSWEEIAHDVGLDWRTALAAVERVLERTRGKADALAEKAREIELRRCDAIIRSFWERATDPALATVEVPANNEAGFKLYDGQDKAADRLLKAMERRAKLLGLDAPSTAVQVNVLQAPPVLEFASAVSAFLSAICPEHSATVDAWLAAVDRDLDGARSDPAGWLTRYRSTITVEAEET